MSHFLPAELLEKVEQDLKQTVAEYEASLRVLKQEEGQLEADLVQAVEAQKMDEVRKKLASTI